MRITERVIRRLPKTDLHCHLDGCLRPRTVLELAQAQGVKLPTRSLAQLTKVLKAGKRTRNLEEYLKIFDLTLAVMQEKEALYRVAYELAEDAAAENVCHLEVRYSPILHRKRKLGFEDIVDTVIAGLHDAGSKFGMTTGVIICGIRSMDPKFSLALAELAVAYKGKGVLAFDLAGQEKDYPAKAHRAAFELILKNNINSTVHAGEAFGPASISQALHYCGAHRIGHGTLLLEDRDLMQYVNDHRIPLEMCLTSNLQTGAVQNIKEHPARLLLPPGPARHREHRQPAHVGHHRDGRDQAGGARVPPQPLRGQAAHHQRLQELLPALCRQGPPPARGEPRDGPDLHGGVPGRVRPAPDELLMASRPALRGARSRAAGPAARRGPGRARAGGAFRGVRRLHPLRDGARRRQPGRAHRHELRLLRHQLQLALALLRVPARHGLRAHGARGPVGRRAGPLRHGRFLGVSTAIVDNAQGTNALAETEFTPAGTAFVERSRIANSPVFSSEAVSDQDLICLYSDQPGRPPRGLPG